MGTLCFADLRCTAVFPSLLRTFTLRILSFTSDMSAVYTKAAQSAAAAMRDVPLGREAMHQ